MEAAKNFERPSLTGRCSPTNTPGSSICCSEMQQDKDKH